METGKSQQHIHGTESEIQLNNEGKTGIAIAYIKLTNNLSFRKILYASVMVFDCDLLWYEL